MECGAMANWLNRLYCHLGNSYVDELVAYIVLVVLCLAMMVGLVNTLIKNWNPPSTQQRDQSDAGTGSVQK